MTNQAEFPMYLFVLIGFIVSVILIRLIFSIPTIIRQLKAHTSLLALIAEKQGVSIEEIREIENKADEYTGKSLIENKKK